MRLVGKSFVAHLAVSARFAFLFLTILALALALALAFARGAEKVPQDLSYTLITLPAKQCKQYKQDKIAQIAYLLTLPALLAF